MGVWGEKDCWKVFSCTVRHRRFMWHILHYTPIAALSWGVVINCPESWRKFDRTDFDSFVTSLFHIVRWRGEVQHWDVRVYAVNTPAVPVACLSLPALCPVAEWTSPETTAGIMGPWVLAHTSIKQRLVHTCTQVSLLNVSLYRKRFSFYRKVMTIKITGLAIKRSPYNAVAKETCACSLGETSHCDAWRDKQTDGPSIKLYLQTIHFIVQNVLRVSPFP